MLKVFYIPPERVIAYLRYIPSEKGSRYKNEKYYKKIHPLEKRFKYLKNNYPKYIFYSEKLQKYIQSVKSKDIKRKYDPTDKLREIGKKKQTPIEKTIIDFSDKIIKKSRYKT
ncbi:hypothetical protein AKJ65_03100 [candidate division MSBL1 archaeon SCGC-AAA259E19]|uniref:Uncharacterized protein n=2 Tax=candidate division MSBL1 TaxID=215777 RepID=A0A133V2V4_9EURY|nr:hypothetical protein AKJ65_03100 [candidate division MSBL1 archaeon SCGC-AAA259E19]KXB00782.1 hypothetical protein AKJ41_03675 [candidate division MSBL1 archaeon SCGC-AAA259O05]